MILGIHMALLIGPGVPLPAPYSLAESLSSVTVTQSETGRSVFSLTFQVGRSGVLELIDSPLVAHPLLEPMNRVIIVVVFNATPRVLADGLITQRSFQPSEDPGRSTLTVTCEDVSLSMDLIALKMPHPSMDEMTRVSLILARYSFFWGGLPPIVIPPASLDFPVVTSEIPAQAGTDLEYVRTLASRFNYVFFVKPGPLPGQNAAYWGPLPRVGFPQRALSINMGPFSNLESLTFQQNALAPMAIADVVPGPRNMTVPVIVPMSIRVPLAARPSIPFRTELSGSAGITGETDSEVGLSYARTLVRAQSRVNRSHDDVVTASGTLDALQYGDILEPRGLVGVRGAGLIHDGLYYVKSVTHNIGRGTYKQNFQLSREGTISYTPVVRP